MVRQWDWEGREALVRRAKKRRLWLLAIIIPISVGSSVLTDALSHHRTTHPHHHPSAATAITLVVVVLVIYAVAIYLAVLFVRKRGRRLFGGYPIEGLPRGDRRRVARAIRTASPSADPILANVERETSERVVDRNPRLIAIGLTAIGLVYVSAAVLTRSDWARACLAALALLSPLAYLLYRRQAARARRYLAAPGARGQPNASTRN